MSNPLLNSTTHTHLVSEIRNFHADNTMAPNPPTQFDSAPTYEVNSIWTDEFTDISYICVDSTPGSAIWQVIASPTSGSVFVNETRFVDLVYGGGNVQNDMTKSWIDVQNAYATSPSPGTVYVQPGDYQPGGPISLRDGVNLYFAEGARVTASAGFSIFEHLSGDVSVRISGHGVFTIPIISNIFTVMDVRASGHIIFEADAIVSDSQNVFYIENNTATNTLTIDIDVARINNAQKLDNFVVQVFPSTIGFITLNLRSQDIVSGALIYARSGGALIGTATIDAQTISMSSTASGDSVAGGAIVRNESLAFHVYIDCPIITCESDTHAFQVAVASPSAATTSIAAQTITCRALASVVGGPPPVPQLHISTQRIVQLLNSVPVTANILLSDAVFRAEWQSYRNQAIHGATYYEVDANSDSRVELHGETLEITATVPLFRFRSASTLVARIATIVSGHQLLFNSDSTVAIASNTIQCGAALSAVTGAIQMTGSDAALTLSVASLLSVAAGAGFVQQLSGRLIMSVGTCKLTTTGSGTAISVGNTATADVVVNTLDYSAATSNITGVYSVGNTKVNIGSILLSTTQNAFALNIVGNKTTGTIGRINNTSANGNGLIVSGSTASFTGTIGEIEFVGASNNSVALTSQAGAAVSVICQNIRMGSGMAIVHAGANSTMRVEFQRITTQSAVAAAIFCDDTATGVFSGQSIELVSGSTNVVRVGNAQNVTVNVESIVAGSLGACFEIDLASGMQFYGNYTSALSNGAFTGLQPAFIKLSGSAADALFSITGGSTTMVGNAGCPIVRHATNGTSTLRFGTASNDSGNANENGVHTLGSANLSAYFDSLRVFDIGLYDQSVGNVWFEAKLAHTELGPIVGIEPATSVATTRLTVGGGVFHSPNAPRTIWFANNSIRKLYVLPSTLICDQGGASKTIEASSAGQTVILAPTIGNAPLDVPNITVEPAGTYQSNAAVFF